ncbi:MAG: hypothetical protein ACREIT_10245 [Tepidisphaeraceae bacterium]
MQCNIDAKGKAIRLAYGAGLVGVGVVLALAWAWPTGSVWAWVIAGVCATGGAFAIFEARAGWCVIRAMGFKTPN